MNILEKHVFEEHLKHIHPEWTDFAYKITSLQSSDTFTVLYATDVHYIRKYARYVPSYYQVEEMVKFSGAVGADLLALGGDLADGNTTHERQCRDLYDLVSLVRESKTTSVALSRGNHDDCSWYTWSHSLPVEGNTLSERDWYSQVVNRVRASYPILLDEKNPMGGYYAVDDAFHKVRVLNLNTNDYAFKTDAEGKFASQKDVGHWSFGLREAQLRWLASMLVLPGKDWSVLLMSHACPFLNEDEPVHNGKLVLALLKAFLKGEKGTLTSDDPAFPAEIAYDYTNAPSNDLMPYLYGHVHRDTVRVVDGITAVSTRDLLGDSSAKLETWDNPNLRAYNSWDVMLFDKASRVLKIRRYGMPECDRDIAY